MEGAGESVNRNLTLGGKERGAKRQRKQGAGFVEHTWPGREIAKRLKGSEKSAVHNNPKEEFVKKDLRDIAKIGTSCCSETPKGTLKVRGVDYGEGKLGVKEKQGGRWRPIVSKAGKIEKIAEQKKSRNNIKKGAHINKE